jgi:hypothetical protein
MAKYTSNMARIRFVQVILRTLSKLVKEKHWPGQPSAERIPASLTGKPMAVLRFDPAYQLFYNISNFKPKLIDQTLKLDFMTDLK